MLCYFLAVNNVLAKKALCNCFLGDLFIVNNWVFALLCNSTSNNMHVLYSLSYVCLE